MANRKHLKILGQGVETWNSWRADNPKIFPNLRGANLRGRYLQDANLAKADIRGADFTNANLTSAELTEAKAGQPLLWRIIWQFISGIFCSTYFFVWTIITVIFSLLLSFNFTVNGSNPYFLNIFVPGGISIIILAMIFWYLVNKGFSYLLMNLSIFFTIIVVTIILDRLANPAQLTARGVEGLFYIFFYTILPGFIIIAGAIPFTIAFFYSKPVSLIVSLLWFIQTSSMLAFVLKTLANNEILELGGGKIVSVAMIIGSLVIPIFYIYIAWRTIDEDPKYLKLRKVAIAFATIGGTNFTRANLTKANFTKANLKHTNFKYATLTETRFHLAQNINRVKIDEGNRKKWSELNP